MKSDLIPPHTCYKIMPSISAILAACSVPYFPRVIVSLPFASITFVKPKGCAVAVALSVVALYPLGLSPCFHLSPSNLVLYVLAFHSY
jgi:hypothetical protein